MKQKQILINLKQLSSSPAKSQEHNNEKDVQILDKLIEANSNNTMMQYKEVRKNEGEFASKANHDLQLK